MLFMIEINHWDVDEELSKTRCEKRLFRNPVYDYLSTLLQPAISRRFHRKKREDGRFLTTSCSTKLRTFHNGSPISLCLSLLLKWHTFHTILYGSIFRGASRLSLAEKYPQYLIRVMPAKGIKIDFWKASFN